ncbi:acyltransferase [Phocaeicola sp.]
MKLILILKKIRDYWYKYVVWRKYKIGKNFHCGRGVFLWARDDITIGNDFYIGKYSIIETNCIIGNGVIFANYVGVVGKYDHCYEEIGMPVRLATSIRDREYQWKGMSETTVIGDDVWIGFGAIILSGVNVSDGCIIAAGALVTNDTEPYSIYAGMPARKVKDRFNTEEEKLKHIRAIKERYI